MEKTVTLEEALKRIEELEKENAELREELEYYRNRKLSGRQKHNAKWMAIYNDFVVGYESGMTMVEIAKRNNVSERTIYRYKAYYDKLRKKEEQTILLTSVKWFNATEMTNYNVEEKDLQGETAITVEHVENNTSVRDMLGQRGIVAVPLAVRVMRTVVMEVF